MQEEKFYSTYSWSLSSTYSRWNEEDESIPLRKMTVRVDVICHPLGICDGFRDARVKYRFGDDIFTVRCHGEALVQWFEEKPDVQGGHQ